MTRAGHSALTSKPGENYGYKSIDLQKVIILKSLQQVMEYIQKMKTCLQ